VVHDGDAVSAVPTKVVVVRAWREGARVVVRLLASDPGGSSQPDERVVGSVDDACKTLRVFLQDLGESSSDETED
jgi:hypothetical protein